MSRIGSSIVGVVGCMGLIAVAFQTGGCGPSTPPPDNMNTNTNTNDNANTNDNSSARVFAGAATCVTCHSGTHSDWSSTAHARALQTLKDIGQHENAICLPCHTVGFGETGGYVDEASTPQLIGVQCENCHGASAAHAANPGDAALRPPVNNAATLCGQCHTDAHHPTFDEWQLSSHASALAGLRANNFARDSCLECHSQDYRYALEQQAAGKTVEVPTLATAQLSIECSTCHSPHGGVDVEKQLRLDVATLCGQCHTQGEEVLPGNTPHHPQLEMLTGEGAFEEGGDALTAAGAHTSLTNLGGAACAQCHVVMHEVDDPNEGNPNVTGHTFNPFDESIATHQAEQYTGCLACHSAEGAAQRRTDVQESIAQRLSALAPFFDAASASYIDRDTLGMADQERLDVAKFNVDFVNADGSTGVHNPTYTRAALDIAEAIVDDLTASTP